MYNEKTIDEKLVYKGNVISVYELQIEHLDKTTAKREVARHNGGACVVAIDDDENIYIVRQYRKPIDSMTIEIPAGKLEIGEAPYLCAIRELKEETGIQAENIESLGFIYPTPGYCDEKLYIYLATGLKRGDMNLDEGEFLSCEKLALDDCLEKIDNGEITDAKTVVGILRTAAKIRKDINK